MVAPACSRSAAEEAAFWRERAGLLAAENTRLAAENATLAATVEAQRQQVEALRQRVVTLSRMLFGTSSEKSGPGQHDGGGEGPAGDDDSQARSGHLAGRRRRGQRPGSAGHGRRRHEHLDAEEHVHDLPEDQRRCPRCGRPYQLLGEDVSEQVSWRVRVWRVVHRRRKYARRCRCPVPAVLTAPGPPQLTVRSLFTSEFCVNLLVAKYALGLPFNRVIAMLSFQGLQVAPGTLAGVARRLGQLLAPLAAAIAARNAAAGHAHADETSWRVFGQPADNGGSRWWLWVFTGPDTVVYKIAPSRSLTVIEEHYGVSEGQLPAGRGPLIISSDFYSVYQSFCQARRGHATVVLGAYPAAVHPGRGRPPQEPGPVGRGVGGPDRRAVRRAPAAGRHPGRHPRARSCPAEFRAALDEIDAHRRIQGARPDLLHPAAAKVLATLDREWDGLAAHREFPSLPLDNNTAERAIRGPVVGRKNYNGSGSRWSADLAGHAWTILGTATMAGHNPRAYLSAYLDACAASGGKPPAGEKLEALLPWNISLPADPGRPP